MLLPELKNHQEGQWTLWNPPRASSDTVATFSASPGWVHLSFPWFQQPHGKASCLICVPYYSMAPSSWEPGLSPPESLLDWTQTGEALSVTEAVTRPSPGVKRDLLEVAEATLVLSQCRWQTEEEGREHWPQHCFQKWAAPPPRNRGVTWQAKGKLSWARAFTTKDRLLIKYGYFHSGWLLHVTYDTLWSPPLPKFSVKLRLGHNSWHQMLHRKQDTKGNNVITR